MAIIEILTLNLRQGTRAAFHQLYITECLPLLYKWKFKIIAHGPSYHDENSYYVIRSFQSLEERQQMEDAYYSSNDWQQGPREAVMALLERDSYIVVPPETIRQWLTAVEFL
jgi:hypothetical protein